MRSLRFFSVPWGDCTGHSADDRQSLLAILGAMLERCTGSCLKELQLHLAFDAIFSEPLFPRLSHFAQLKSLRMSCFMNLEHDKEGKDTNEPAIAKAISTLLASLKPLHFLSELSLENLDQSFARLQPGHFAALPTVCSGVETLSLCGLPLDMSLWKGLSRLPSLHRLWLRDIAWHGSEQDARDAVQMLCSRDPSTHADDDVYDSTGREVLFRQLRVLDLRQPTSDRAHYSCESSIDHLRKAILLSYVRRYRLSGSHSKDELPLQRSGERAGDSTELDCVGPILDSITGVVQHEGLVSYSLRSSLEVAIGFVDDNLEAQLGSEDSEKETYASVTWAERMVEEEMMLQCQQEGEYARHEEELDREQIELLPKLPHSSSWLSTPDTVALLCRHLRAGSPSVDILHIPWNFDQPLSLIQILRSATRHPYLHSISFYLTPLTTLLSSEDGKQALVNCVCSLPALKSLSLRVQNGPLDWLETLLTSFISAVSSKPPSTRLNA